MSLPIPDLDDKSFDDLLNEARALIPIYSKEWTNHNPSDPGITLVELFAWLTEMTIYRLDQVPDENYLQFVELIGGDYLNAIDCGPPSIRELKLQYDTFNTDPDFVFFNEQWIDPSRAIWPFGKNPRLNDVFYLASKEVFAKQGTTVAIHVALSDSIFPNMKGVELIWEYYNKKQWNRIGETTSKGIPADKARAPYYFTDTTMAFMQNGMVAFVCPAIDLDQVNGEENYWIRVRILGDTGGLEFKIREALQLMARQTRAITGRDYEGLALEAMEQLETGLAGRAICLNNRDLEFSLKDKEKPGHVTVMIIPKDNGISPYQENGMATDLLRKKVKAYLNPKRLITARLHVVAPKYKNIKIDILVSLTANKNEKAVLETADKEIAAYFDHVTGGPDGKGWPLGRDIYRSELYQLVEGIEGIDHVDKILLDEEDLSLIALDENQLPQITIGMKKK